MMERASSACEPLKPGPADSNSYKVAVGQAREREERSKFIDTFVNETAGESD